MLPSGWLAESDIHFREHASIHGCGVSGISADLVESGAGSSPAFGHLINASWTKVAPVIDVGVSKLKCPGASDIEDHASAMMHLEPSLRLYRALGQITLLRERDIMNSSQRANGSQKTPDAHPVIVKIGGRDRGTTM